ncbi:hypothetical protein RQP46_004341 [Phenoliferia psychrophenolica]
MRAVVLDERLSVNWVEEVDFDVELGAEFSVVNGCRTFGDEVTAPSAMRLKGLDLLLEKLAREAPDPSLMGRIRAISGSGQSNFLASLFIGRFAPIDATDACSTNLFNVLDGDWDDEVLGIVMGVKESSQIDATGNSGGVKLRAMLGDVGKDGGKELGSVSPYFVDRFGFSPSELLPNALTTD